MLPLRSIVRLSLLASAVAFAGLASFPGTAAEARSPEPAPVTDASALEQAPELDELVPATIVAKRGQPSARPSAFSYDAYRR